MLEYLWIIGDDADKGTLYALGICALLAQKPREHSGYPALTILLCCCCRGLNVLQQLVRIQRIDVLIRSLVQRLLIDLSAGYLLHHAFKLLIHICSPLERKHNAICPAERISSLAGLLGSATSLRKHVRGTT